MDENLNYKTYLFVSSKKFVILVKLNSKKKIYENELIVNQDSDQLNYEQLNYFLSENIFKIEKILNDFVNNIYLIIDHKEFFSINVSLQTKNYGNSIDIKKISYLLNEAKEQCRKTIQNRKIVHMVIDNYLVDKKSFSFFPKEIECDFFSIDLNIICFSNEIIDNLEKVLKNYQITVNRILSHQYLNNFQNINTKKDIFEVAQDILDGYNKNEVFLTDKTSKNKGFFEKFFFFFS
jgi:hypothetical protein